MIKNVKNTKKTYLVQLRIINCDSISQLLRERVKILHGRYTGSVMYVCIIFDLICSSQLIPMEPSNIFTFMGYLSMILKLVVYIIFNDSA